jgi:hypothetical protein
MTYEDPRKHSNPAEQLRRDQIPVTYESMAKYHQRPPLQQMVSKELGMRGPRRIDFDPTINPKTAGFPLLFANIEGLLALSSAPDPHLDRSSNLCSYVAAGRSNLSPRTRSTRSSPITKSEQLMAYRQLPRAHQTPSPAPGLHSPQI